jgi:hypothetical protein
MPLKSFKSALLLGLQKQPAQLKNAAVPENSDSLESPLTATPFIAQVIIVHRYQTPTSGSTQGFQSSDRSHFWF